MGNQKLNLDTLKKVKFACDLYSDSSSATLGYKWLCEKINELESNGNEKIIEIEKVESNPEQDICGGWTVTYGEKYADGLGYDEMLGLVAAITMPDDRPTLHWLKTAEEHKAWRDRLKSSSQDVELIED